MNLHLVYTGSGFVALCSIVVVVLAATLALHKDYRSGVLGTCGLGLIAMAALTRLSYFIERVLDGTLRPVGFVTAIVWLGLALLMLHLYIKFRLRLRRRGSVDWYESRHFKLIEGP